MTLKEWKIKNSRARNYAHFDSKVSLNKVWKYISDPNLVKKHGFYPFIHYKHNFHKFNKSNGVKQKHREICYSAHIDRYIFQYYSFMLNNLYNIRAIKDNINNSSVAYRDNLKKNNVHFAKEAIDFIRQVDSCYIIIGDFTKFFDSLNHRYLKQMICDLLGTCTLPDDYYAVFKNITKYSIWELDDLLKLNGLANSRSGIVELNKLDLVLPKEKFKELKKQYIYLHKDPFGIPQGSSISAVLSNIYMLKFDKQIKDYVSDKNGLYMRYSDDFIVVLPKQDVSTFKDQFDYINKILMSIPNLKLEPEKTQIFEYATHKITSCNTLVLKDVANGKDQINYLGFTFDGNKVFIRDKTLSKYYYKMYRKLKTIVNSKGYTKKGKKISCKNLYNKYSIKGAYKDGGNFITYVQRAEGVFGINEAIGRGTKNHMQKIRKRLDFLK